LAQAMLSRATIEQAKGIIIATSGCTEDEAMKLLVQQSQHQNVKVREIAREIVDNAMRRSR
jgi:AmiR/NasT family two-component response regulator